MEVTVSNWAGSPIERAGTVFPPRRAITVDVDPARVNEIRSCRSLELHGDTPSVPIAVHVCECGFAAKTAGGLKAHKRAKHPEKNEPGADGDEPSIPHGQAGSGDGEDVEELGPDAPGE